MTSPAPAPKTRAGLFRRIYLTFVLTVIGFAALAAVAVFAFATKYDAGWVETVETTVTARTLAISENLDQPDALAAELEALARELDLRVALRTPSGQLIAGDPTARSPRSMGPRNRGRARHRLQRGQPVVQRDDHGPILTFGITNADGDLVAALSLDPGSRGAKRTRQLGLALLGLLVVLAAAAWPLARSLTRRIAYLETGAERIARGELSHRVPGLADGDELDRLGIAFNHMAGQLETMLRGQRALLTNVSHELRTPIARMRVLAELLDERLDTLPTEHPAVIRLRRGISELGEDLAELETLIADLLTSGRLDLAGGPALQRSQVAMAPLLERVASKIDAAVTCDPQLQADCDIVLVERLLTNLANNARRACPAGTVSLAATIEGPELVLSVEDEGPGIAPADRTIIFDPFTRLDEARARDHGGVGLGLYLCRQIAVAHGGTICAEDRRDGRPGARLVVRLPVTPTAPTT